MYCRARGCFDEGDGSGGVEAGVGGMWFLLVNIQLQLLPTKHTPTGQILSVQLPNPAVLLLPKLDNSCSVKMTIKGYLYYIFRDFYLFYYMFCFFYYNKWEIKFLINNFFYHIL